MIDYQGAAEPNQIFTCSIDGVGQSFSEKNECCWANTYAQDCIYHENTVAQ